MHLLHSCIGYPWLPLNSGLKHWRKINGFGNNYFGWGGEERDAAIAVNLENLAASRQHLHELVVWQDDELHHRLRLGGLLYGDCAFGRTLVSLGVTLCAG